MWSGAYRSSILFSKGPVISTLPISGCYTHVFPRGSAISSTCNAARRNHCVCIHYVSLAGIQQLNTITKVSCTSMLLCYACIHHRVNDSMIVCILLSWSLPVECKSKIPRAIVLCTLANDTCRSVPFRGHLKMPY